MPQVAFPQAAFPQTAYRGDEHRVQAGPSTSGRPTERTSQATRNLENSLLEMFPDKSKRIRNLLSRHPCENNIELFIDDLVG